jgi:hypothetical protein
VLARADTSSASKVRLLPVCMVWVVVSLSRPALVSDSFCVLLFLPNSRLTTTIPTVAEECADSRQRDISDLDILVGPLVEQLDAANLRGDILGQDGVALGLLDFDFSGVRHFGDVMRKGGREMGGWRGRQESRFARWFVC